MSKNLIFIAIAMFATSATTQASDLNSWCGSQLISADLFDEAAVHELCLMSQHECKTKLLTKYVIKPGAAELICHSYDNINIALAIAYFDAKKPSHFLQALKFGTNNSAHEIKQMIQDK